MKNSNNIQQRKAFRSGMVALVGPPNVGKSTLLNTLLGQKIAIVTPKPQTTRNRIMGIVNGPDHQVVLLDTPGIHQARDPLNREMVKIALATLTEVDLIVFMVDASMPEPAKRGGAGAALAGTSCPTILVINKIDLVAKPRLLPLIDAYQALHPFDAVVPLSALTGEATDLLVQEIVSRLPCGPKLFPDDIPTDMSERFIVAEMIREQVFLKTREEVPYSTAVVVESFKEDEQDRRTFIHATILVERPSQKGIVIGKQGKMLKEIGAAARQEIERLLGQKVVLKLWVKVEKEWSKNPRVLRELGF